MCFISTCASSSKDDNWNSDIYDVENKRVKDIAVNIKHLPGLVQEKYTTLLQTGSLQILL